MCGSARTARYVSVKNLPLAVEEEQTLLEAPDTTQRYSVLLAIAGIAALQSSDPQTTRH